MENAFYDIMLKPTDAELINILNSNPDDYQPDAMEAAKNEFERRNLSEENIITAKQEILEKQHHVAAKATIPLGVLPKIISFLFPEFLLLLFAGTYKADGYDRKTKEMIKWTLYGIGFYVGFCVLMFILANFLK